MPCAAVQSAAGCAGLLQQLHGAPCCDAPDNVWTCSCTVDHTLREDVRCPYHLDYTQANVQALLPSASMQECSQECWV